MALTLTRRKQAEDSLVLPKELRWTTQEDLKIKPVDMRTSHIFHTVVMLWHHRMPSDAILYQHKRYRLGELFTEDYCKIFIKVFLAELAVRQDLTDYMLSILQKMQAYLKANPKCLDHKQGQIEWY